MQSAIEGMAYFLQVSTAGNDTKCRNVARLSCDACLSNVRAERETRTTRGRLQRSIWCEPDVRVRTFLASESTPMSASVGFGGTREGDTHTRLVDVLET